MENYKSNNISVVEDKNNIMLKFYTNIQELHITDKKY